MTLDPPWLDELTEVRHDLHRHPEIGFDLERTKTKVAQWLEQAGIETHIGTGVVGVLRCGSGNRAIGLRADMDALPIQETSGLDHGSTVAHAMHACGHDGHTSMLLSAARSLAEAQDFDGTVIFLFQPNEEHGLGAKAMIDEGVLKNWPIDEVYGIHNLPGAPVGQISTRNGVICSSENLFEIAIFGKGGHASMPQAGVDAITVGSELVMALQTIVSRKLAPGAGSVISVTEFITDGMRNVLPGQATLKGDARARSPADRLDIETHMRRICDGVAQSHGVHIDFQFRTEFIETINSPEPTQAVIRAAHTVAENVIPDRPPMSFSEDFAHFSNAVPGCFLLMGNGTDGPQGQPLHASNYDFNDALLPLGTAFWHALVRDRLGST